MKFSRSLAIASLAAAVALPLAALAQSQSAGCNAKGNSPMKVKLTTSMGPIVIQLDKEKAPVSVDAARLVRVAVSSVWNGGMDRRV